MKIVLKELNLSRIWQIIAPRVERENVNTWLHDAIQILIESLFRRKFATPRKMVIELTILHNFISLLLTVWEFPLHVEETAAMGYILHPASSYCSPLDIQISWVETKHDFLLFFIWAAPIFGVNS